MNYRHAYHAGNFADVVKHAVFARLVEYLKRKDKPFRVFDLHGGLGLYDLGSDEAARTAEWQGGIAKVTAAEPPQQVAALLSPYLSAVEAAGPGRYPGSPYLVRHLLRRQDRLAVYELHPEDIMPLRALFAGDHQVRVQHLDGWLAPAAHLPPKEARGAMLIDPPFEDGRDFDRMIDALVTSHRRWAGGTVALWYPVKRRAHTDEWLGTLRGLGVPDLLNLELTIREPRSPSMLNGCGLVIARPPYTLRDELEVMLGWLSRVLAVDKGAGVRIQSLSGDHRPRPA